VIGVAVKGLFYLEVNMAVSISDRKWIQEEGGIVKEKIEFMIDSPSDVASLPDPARISAASVAVIKTTKQTVFIINGAWTV
jgi:hypothetical protein